MKTGSKNRWGLRAIAIALAGVLALGACAREADELEDDPRVVTIAVNIAPTTLDPALIPGSSVSYLVPLYEALVLRDPEGLLQPGLATDWQLSEDATKLDMTIREGVTFHDGAVLDAEAVKANLDAAPERGGLIAAQLSILTGVEVLDSMHVRLSMNRPAADMIGVLAGEAGMMVSPDALGADDLATHPAGTGPFILAEFNEGVGISYQAWDGYWNRDRIKIDRIDYVTGLNDQARLNSILTGEADVAQLRYTQIAEQESRAPDTVVSVTGPAAFVYGIMVNTAEGEWANPVMRKVVMHAIDRSGISEALFDGGCEPVAQPFPTEYWASDPSLEESGAAQYNPDLARQMLEDAGLAGVEVSLYVGEAALFQNVATAVQEQLNAVGMNVSVEVLDVATLSDLRAQGDFETSIASVQTGNPDPAQFVQQFYTPDGVFNYGGLVFEGIEEPLIGLTSTLDQDERAGYMHEIMSQVLDQGPTMIPICSPVTVAMHNAELGGVHIPTNYANDYSTIYYKDDE